VSEQICITSLTHVKVETKNDFTAVGGKIEGIGKDVTAVRADMYNGFNSFKAEMEKNFTTVVAQLRPRRKSLMQNFKENETRLRPRRKSMMQTLRK
jgi:hypothetical protein